ncbi:unnamed protein product [Ectocarpus sp. CCAP 1310/34]|nr:unnamed protein product [Ectocarpus sp. CCAP 1310/34]
MSFVPLVHEPFHPTSILSYLSVQQRPRVCATTNPLCFKVKNKKKVLSKCMSHSHRLCAFRHLLS